MELTERPGKNKRKVGLILSGGGARGFAHIGTLRVLERANIHVDVVAGTSIGAILGALYASGYSADEIFDLAKSVSWRHLLDFSMQAGLLKGEKLHDLLALHLPADFGELKKPLAVATTDVETGDEVFILEGDLVTAVRASSCYPGAFEPVSFNGRMLADGGIVNNLPVNAVAFLGANCSIASDATAPRRAAFSDPLGDENWWRRMTATIKLERRSLMAQMVLRSTDIMQSILTDIQYNMHPADVRVQHAMPHVRVESFWAFDEIVALGEWEAMRVFGQAGLLSQEVIEAYTPPEGIPEDLFVPVKGLR